MTKEDYEYIITPPPQQEDNKMDKDDIIKELEARIAELEKRKEPTIAEKDIYPGMALEDRDGDRFLVSTSYDLYELSSGRKFSFYELCHPVTQVDIGISKDRGVSWEGV